jgi:hypothetical protein
MPHQIGPVAVIIAIGIVVTISAGDARVPGAP